MMEAQTISRLALSAAGQDCDFVSGSPFRLGQDALPEGVSAGVYIVEDRDGLVLYVGSVRRSPGSSALADRIGREHSQEAHKVQHWDRVHVVALKPETTTQRVRVVESILAHELRPLYGIHPQGWDL
jgi:hypothetical protein